MDVLLPFHSLRFYRNKIQEHPDRATDVTLVEAKSPKIPKKSRSGKSSAHGRLPTADKYRASHEGLERRVAKYRLRARGTNDTILAADLPHSPKQRLADHMPGIVK